MAPGAHEEQRSGAGPQRKAVDGCPEALRTTNNVQSGAVFIWCRFVIAGERRRARGGACSHVRGAPNVPNRGRLRWIGEALTGPAKRCRS